jgi:hypothetical protein
VKTVYKGKEAYREELMDKEREAMAFPNAAHGGQEMERPFYLYFILKVQAQSFDLVSVE